MEVNYQLWWAVKLGFLAVILILALWYYDWRSDKKAKRKNIERRLKD